MINSGYFNILIHAVQIKLILYLEPLIVEMVERLLYYQIRKGQKWQKILAHLWLREGFKKPSVALATESSGYVGSRTLCDLLLFLLLPLVLILLLVLFLSCIWYNSLVHCNIITNHDSEIFSYRETARQTDGQTERPTNKGTLRSSSSWSFKLWSGWGSKTVLGCAHVVKDLLFSKFSTILTFDFSLILG